MTAVTLATLPELSAKSGIAVDRLRRVVRINPHLKELGVVIGASRAFNLEECAQIIEAANERNRQKVAAK